MANLWLLAQRLGHNIWQWMVRSGRQGTQTASQCNRISVRVWELLSGKVFLFISQNCGTLHEIIINRRPFENAIV